MAKITVTDEDGIVHEEIEISTEQLEALQNGKLRIIGREHLLEEILTAVTAALEADEVIERELEEWRMRKESEE